MFRGANAISLDAKGRLAMPSRYRDELISKSAGQLIVTIDAVDPCLCVYPLDEWELIETKLRALPSLREENRRLQRLLIGNAVDLELDGSGRFLVPPRLREYARLDKRAMLVGQLNKFQLWDEDAWEAVSAADLAAIQQPGDDATPYLMHNRKREDCRITAAPARWLMAWCMSPVRWLLINIITCCLPMTQRRKPATFWKLSTR